jgi:transcriptional regulator with XRE-family HTH domain
MDFHQRIKLMVGELAAGKHTVFAKKCGIPPSTMQTYITGTSIPKADHLAKIVSAYRINLNWLLVGEGEPFFQERGEAIGRAATSPAGEEMLREIIMAVEEWLNRRGLTLAPAKKADLVIELYRTVLEEDKKVDKDMVGEVFLKLVA